MNNNDALSILNVTGEYTPEIIKTAYRKACSKYHPDRNPAGLEMMKLVNQAYEALKEATGNANDSESLSTYGEDICNALNAIIGLGLDIEICGSWVWLHGDTKPHKDLLKASGSCGHRKRNCGTSGQRIINQEVGASTQWRKSEKSTEARR
jgi:hypothetical protein